jgi:hypothetical protein
MLRIAAVGLRALSHRKPRFLIYSHIKDNKTSKKTNVGWLKEVARGNERHLVPRIVARGIGLSQAFQDGAHCLQNIVGHMRIPGDPWDGRHAKVHQDLGGTPHQNCQSPSLGDTLHLSFLQAPVKLDELHQLLTIVPGVETPRLRLHQFRLMQVKVSLSPIELDLLVPQHLVKAEGVLGAGGVHFYLVDVLLSSRLGFCSFGVKVGADLDLGLLRNLSHLVLRPNQMIIVCVHRNQVLTHTV